MSDGTTYDPVKYGARCDICPLKGQKVSRPRGPATATVALVADSPGFQDEKNGVLFAGSSEKILKEVLPNELPVSATWRTALVLCRGEVPTIEGTRRYYFEEYIKYAKKEGYTSPIEACWPRLEKELKYLESRRQSAPNGLVVVPMGNFAIKTFIGGRGKGLKKWRGSPVPVKLP